MSRPLPTARHSVYLDAPGIGFGIKRNEYEVDGVAFRTTVRVKLYFRSGSPRLASTVMAPAAARQRYRYLRSLRFFLYFFTDPRGLPRTVCGLDIRGHRSTCERFLR